MWEGQVEPQEPERVGAVLQRSRLHAGFDLAEASQYLHIRRGYLEAIEQGRFEALPGPAYAAGFVRAYAGFLGLDAGAMVDRLRRETGIAPRSALHFPEPVADGKAPRAGMLLIGAAIALLAYGGWYMTSLHAPDAGRFVTESERGAAAPDAAVEAVVPAEPAITLAAPAGIAGAAGMAADGQEGTGARVASNGDPPAASATTALAAEPPRFVLRPEGRAR